MRGQQHAPAALYARERPGTHFTGGWGGPQRVGRGITLLFHDRGTSAPAVLYARERPGTHFTGGCTHIALLDFIFECMKLC